MPQIASYGSWSSPISAARVLEGSVRIEQVITVDNAVWWSELRPSEGGRSQIVRRATNDSTIDVLPDGFSASSAVHEYGGGAWWVAGETVFFVDRADQRIWRMDPGFDPVAVTDVPLQDRGLRYADGVTTADHRWIICVQEVHPGEFEHDGRDEAINRLVAIPAAGGEVTVLRDDADFVMSPRLDPGSTLLAWVEWRHPNMPWDGTELWVAHIDRAPGLPPTLRDATHVTGGSTESIVQPEWGDDGHLWFLSDRTDWWNLYRCDNAGVPGGFTTRVGGGQFEVATPAWVFGGSRYALLEDGRVVFAYASDGVDHLASTSPGGAFEHVPVPYTSIDQVRATQGSAVFIGASFTAEPSVVALLVGRGGSSGSPQILRHAPDASLSSSCLAEGRPITFPTAGGRVAHGIFYEPTNPEFQAPAGERPPLIVMIHGGPTSCAGTQLNLRYQFWTSRGFAVVDVNYRGSTGFGRKYRNELRGQWGVADVEDCVAAASFLAQAGRADASRLIIRGGSAGGFTTLCALTFSDVFATGASLYGISDLEALIADDHKFESRYCDGLIAPYPAGADVYRERSPIHHLEGLDRPVILFQGLDDKVVPPAQSQMMADALRLRGVPFAYIAFEGEGHGFRQAANITRCLEAELSFYAQVLGFAHPPDIEPVTVENLP